MFCCALIGYWTVSKQGEVGKGGVVCYALVCFSRVLWVYVFCFGYM